LRLNVVVVVVVVVVPIEGCRQFCEHFMSSFLNESVLGCFCVLTVCGYNFLAKQNS